MIENARLTAYTADGAIDVPVVIVGDSVMNTAAITLASGDFLELTYTTTLDPDEQTFHIEGPP